MSTVQQNIPDGVDLREYDFSIIVAAKLYEEAKFSAHKQPRLLDYRKEHLLKC